MYIVLGGYLRILGAPSIQSCCTVSISPAFMRSRTSHPAGPHDCLAQKNLHMVCHTTVTAPPRVGCVFGAHTISSSGLILVLILVWLIASSSTTLNSKPC